MRYGAAVDPADLKTSVISTIGITAKRHSPCIVTRDRETGGWRTRSFGGTLIDDDPRGPTWARCKTATYELFLREYEPHAGDVVVELGAGSGTETVILSRLVGATGRVIAFEASPRAAHLLRATLAANKMTNVEVVEVAISDKPGVVALHERGGAGSIRSTLMEANHESEIAIPADTLDAVLTDRDIGQIDLLKVNIEGAERLMLHGMNETLPKVRNAVISCHDFIADKIGEEDYRTRAEVAEFFTKAGFTVTSQPEDRQRPWVRDYLYATHPAR